MSQMKSSCINVRLEKQVLEQDELWLKRKCYQPEGPYLRPFAPNPAWKKALVFIVGLNPSTPFRGEFESYEQYWDSLTRNPELFLKAYYGKHQCREEEKSRTSRTISELVEYLSPLNVLVTNVYPYPTPDPKLIPKVIRKEPLDDRVLPHLIKVCKPRILLFHGREARSFAERYFKVKLNPYGAPARQSHTVTLQGSNYPTSLFAYHHFVGRVEKHAVMRERLKEFAEQIHSLISEHHLYGACS